MVALGVVPGPGLGHALVRLRIAVVAQQRGALRGLVVGATAASGIFAFGTALVRVASAPVAILTVGAEWVDHRLDVHVAGDGKERHGLPGGTRGGPRGR